MTAAGQAPETVEGWYALHQLFTVDHAAVGALGASECDRQAAQFAATIKRESGAAGEHGWSALAPLIGSRADLMVMHFRATLDDLGVVQRRLAGIPFSKYCHPAYTFLSITEAGLYAYTAKLAREAAERGGSAGDERYLADLKGKADAERASDHGRRRLYPLYPGPEMPYVCFYPMDKKREAGQNWYALTLDERSELMRLHGMTGRKYAGRVVQIITGSMGFDAWEWGVTLFARDPLDFKKIVSEMRFDEASARYADFGEFFVGKVATEDDWIAQVRESTGR
jgi:hydrogen peroxide-dependent heme synthase